MASVADFSRASALVEVLVLQEPDIRAGGVPACFFGKGGMCCECCEEGVFGC